jgi:hypothetical protein
LRLRDEAGDTVELPANEKDMEGFIKAYRRICAEPVGYRKRNSE